MRRVCGHLLPILLCGNNASSQNGPDLDEPPSSVISRAFLENDGAPLRYQGSLRRPRGALGRLSPGELYVRRTGGGDREPLKVCKFRPNAANPSTTSTKMIWRARLDTDVLNEDRGVTVANPEAQDGTVRRCTEGTCEERADRYQGFGSLRLTIDQRMDDSVWMKCNGGQDSCFPRRRRR